jgi:hypothetical protein
MERRGKRGRQRRDREIEGVREGEWLHEEVVLVIKMTVEENGQLG